MDISPSYCISICSAQDLTIVGPFSCILGHFSDNFCPWTNYRSHVLTQEPIFVSIFFLRRWLLRLYQVIFFKIFIFSLPYERGGVTYENMRQKTLVLGAVLCSSVLCLFYHNTVERLFSRGSIFRGQPP